MVFSRSPICKTTFTPPGMEQKDAGPQRVSAFLFAGDLRNMSDNSAVVWLDLNHKEAP
jgi:hypothetical protein